MEPVIFPTTIAPVIQTDRVKRSKPREDSGKGSNFSKQLRKEQESQSGAQPPPEENAEDTPAAAADADAEARGARRIPRDGDRAEGAFKKLIDVRV
jgi:hypothetical protein